MDVSRWQALMEELRPDYDKAIFYFEKAILASQSDDKIKDFKQDIERCKMKMEIKERTQKQCMIYDV